MKTIHEVVVATTAFFDERGFRSARRNAEDLVSGALGIGRLDLYTQFDVPLQDEELARCRTFLQRRLQREPIQYIVGKVDFCGCEIRVDSRALIPRPETEILTDRAIRELREGTFLDLCCGSGCIGIAVKRALPEMEVILADKSAEALALAGENAARNEVEVELLEGDLCASLGDRQVDFVLCNPPYIAAEEMSSLEPEVRDWEPHAALEGGESGLLFYHRLASELPAHLRGGGRLWMEIGAGQGEAVAKIFSSAPWRILCLESDWSGHDRFFSLERE